MQLRVIGYWKSADEPDLPDPRDFIDAQWTSDDRGWVSAYFRYGILARAYMGPSVCRICGARNGSREYTDGTFLWPEGFVHYIVEHDVKPPDEVIAWAVDRMPLFEDADSDQEWWLQATARP